jgi:NitT/TauT family transport system substrate-binding protein/putative hydroxymethylpyrimidine transport system substrate-binding protein
MLEHDGGDYRRVKQVTIGFSAVSRLLTGRVDAVPAFWNAEGVALRQRGLAVKEFRVDDYGAPRYPEVVLVTARRTLQRHRDDLQRALRAVNQGLRDTLAHPEDATRRIARAAETPDIALIRSQLDAVSPAFAPGLRFDRDILEQWADFDARIGIVDRRPDVARAFDFTLLGG